jgi:hypothetical protein
VAGMIFFTDNYQDRSTNDGYQFEFYPGPASRVAA